MLVAAAAANALIFFDQTSVATALPRIQADFSASSSEAQWVIGAYLLVLAALMSATGRLADLYGRRALFLGGTAVFGIASVLCALAPSEELLIAARAIQGAGASLTVPLAITSVTAVLPDERRGWAIGWLATGGTAALSVGPLLGGYLTDEVSWRAVFLVNVPVVVAVLVVAARNLPETRVEGERKRLDLVGLVLLVAGLVAVVTALLESQDWGNGDPRTLGLLAAGLVSLGAFWIVERRRDDPLIDVRLLRAPLISSSLLALVVVQLAVLAVTVYVVIYMQKVLDHTALVAGVLILPTLIWSPLLSPTTGRLADRHGARALVSGGLLAAAAGLVWIALVAPQREVLLFIPGFLLFGVSRPLVFTPASTGPVKALPAGERGLASSLVTESRQLGAVLGVALVGAILTGIEIAHRNELLAGVDARLGHSGREALDGILAGSDTGNALLRGLAPGERTTVKHVAADSFQSGFVTAMLITAGLCALAALIAFVGLRRDSGTGT